MAIGQQIACRNRDADKAAGKQRGIEHVGEPIGKTRIEDDRPPVRRIGDAAFHRVAGRRLHPAIGRKNPERRQRGAEGDHQAGEHVQPARHALAAEQKYGEKRRFEKERRQNLVADQRPDDVAGDRREAAPIGAELIGQHDAGHHAHRRTTPRISWSRTRPAACSARPRSSPIGLPAWPDRSRCRS